MLPSNRIPLSLKLLYTAFMLVLVPTYWHQYGPTNFLYFCDVALFFALGAVWLESPLLASMPAVGILMPQALWCVDFIGSCLGVPVMGMTDYMFDEKKLLYDATRGMLSFQTSSTGTVGNVGRSWAPEVDASSWRRNSAVSVSLSSTSQSTEP